jgi:hypothetical protein
MKRPVIGIDIAKNIFQLHTVDPRAPRITPDFVGVDEVNA